MNKEDLLNTIKSKRKKFGNNSKQVYKAIYNLVKSYPYYDGYEDYWLRKNGYNLK